MVREREIVNARGYSDAINHAFAFAAKHHDRQVRKGTKFPYFTQPANVAVILSRYACGESTVVAGILHDVVQDSIREGSTLEILQQRVGEKFGAEVLSFLLAVTQRRLDDDAVADVGIPSHSAGEPPGHLHAHEPPAVSRRRSRHQAG